MDVFDQATELEEKARAMAIQYAIANKPILQACGDCHNCGEALQPDKLFCDEDCRDDWQRRNPKR